MELFYFLTCCMLYREELISHYKQLSDAADLRTTKAHWRICRHRLDRRPADWLQSSSSWTSSADDAVTEVLRIIVTLDGVLKLFQNYFSDIECVGKYS